jgi:hypothetical protein
LKRIGPVKASIYQSLRKGDAKWRLLKKENEIQPGRILTWGGVHEKIATCQWACSDDIQPFQSKQRQDRANIVS